MQPKSPSALLLRRRRNLDRITRGVNDANALLKQFTDRPADAYQLLLRLAGQLAFEAALVRKRGKINLQHQTMVEFSKLLLAARRPRQATRKSSANRPKRATRPA